MCLSQEAITFCHDSNVEESRFWRVSQCSVDKFLARLCASIIFDPNPMRFIFLFYYDPFWTVFKFKNEMSFDLVLSSVREALCGAYSRLDTHTT